MRRARCAQGLPLRVVAEREHHTRLDNRERPNHVSIATDVTAAKHGVMNNADLLYASTAIVSTGLPFTIGQDGTGSYTHPFVGDVDDVAIWTRSLSHEEVRRIWEGARSDKPLARLL